VVKPSSDARLSFPLGIFMANPLLFKLEWDFCCDSDKVDIGFSVVYQDLNGSFPQLVQYHRIGKGKGSIFLFHEVNEKAVHDNVIVNDKGDKYSKALKVNGDVLLIFDNSYSWYTEKNIRYKFTLVSIKPDNAYNEKSIDGSCNSSSDNTTTSYAGTSFDCELVENRNDNIINNNNNSSSCFVKGQGLDNFLLLIEESMKLQGKISTLKAGFSEVMSGFDDEDEE
jgi:hypothetical protein